MPANHPVPPPDTPGFEAYIRCIEWLKDPEIQAALTDLAIREDSVKEYLAALDTFDALRSASGLLTVNATHNVIVKRIERADGEGVAAACEKADAMLKTFTDALRMMRN